MSLSVETVSSPHVVRDQLVELWAELLHLHPHEVVVDRSFLRLGGDSVLAVRMSAMVRQRLGVALALSDVRVETTVNDLVALIERQAGEPGGAPRSLPLNVERRPDPQSLYPLLPLQQGYFVGQQDGWELSYESAHYYLDYGLVGVDGDEAGDALADAIERVAAHQPTLRARVTADGRQHVLDAADPASLPHVTIHDLRDRSTEQARASLDAIRREMSTCGPNPMDGPGIDVRLTLMPEGRGRLHLGLSLLVFDGWSSTLLNRDLLDFVADWNATLAPLELDFGDYVTAVQELRRSDAWATDRDWWWSRLDDLPAPPALPLVADPRDVTPDTMANREVRLPATEWQAVRAACRRRGVTPSVAMLTAFSVALAQWAGHRRLLVNSLQLNRLPIHPDVHRVVGAFASTTFVPVDLVVGATFAELAAAAQTVSGEAAAHNLVSGVEVGRELGRRRRSRRPMGPVVFQSVLGIDAAMGSGPPLDAGPLGTVVETDYFHQLRTPQVALEVRCFELGEQMAAVFSLVDELFDESEVAAAFERFTTSVRELADDDAWDRVPTLPGPADPRPGDERLRLGQLPETDGDAHLGPLTDDVHHAIAEIFEDLLEVPVLDLGAHFFELGGDSLTAVRAVARLARELGVRVAVREFLDHPTVGGVAALVGSNGTTA